MRELIGRIFSIEEFSVYDGPGIRMTVFFKGCPLRCPWCHNPEGQRREAEYKRNPNGCIGCGVCEKLADITYDGMRLGYESMKACPQGLIRLCGEDITVSDLVGRILKNADLLRASGGGVTFSGGEPLLYSDFISECILRLGGLHTALQTSGYASSEIFKKSAELCDLVLFDLKIIDGEEHSAVCGADNSQILENYRHLAVSGKKFITRIPLIPGYTDTKRNLSMIADFMRENGVAYAELLPFNELAGAKYHSVCREFTLQERTASDRTEISDIFEKRDIKILFM